MSAAFMTLPLVYLAVLGLAAYYTYRLITRPEVDTQYLSKLTKFKVKGK